MQMVKKDILLFSLILLLSFLLFLPSFQLALFGDDWLTLWRYFTNLGPNSSGKWNHVSYFFTSYGPQDILMGLLQKIYGYESTYYYLTSYALRVSAAFSLFPLMVYLTNRRSAAYLSIAFFLITTTGIETTNWVFNMPSYIAIIFLNLFFYYFFVSRSNPKKIILSAFFFFLALIAQPIRMHGLLPTIFLLEISWFIQTKKVNFFKKASLRLSIFTTITVALVFLGLGRSPIITPSNLLTQNINQFSKHLEENGFQIFFNPLITLSNTIIPSDVLNLIFSPTESSKLLAFIGLLLITVIVILLIRFYQDLNFINAIILAIIWSVFSFILVWWREPYQFFMTTHRYLIVSAVGISILLGTLISLKKNSGLKTVIIIITSIIFILHIFSTRNYLNTAYSTHNQKISQKIWSAIPYIPEVGKNNKPLVFYFLGDGTNEAILHDVITFGFPTHMGLIYNISEEDKLPITVSEAKELISAAIDGKSVAPYNRPKGAVPIERIYAFQLSGNDTLINITEVARKRLTELKK